MFTDLNRILNITIIAVLSLMLVLALIFLLKLQGKKHPYQGSADIIDSYDPYGKWSGSH